MCLGTYTFRCWHFCWWWFWCCCFYSLIQFEKTTGMSCCFSAAYGYVEYVMFIGIFTDGDFDAAVSINSFNSRKPLECLVVFSCIRLCWMYFGTMCFGIFTAAVSAYSFNLNWTLSCCFQLYTVVRNVKEAHECLEHGETQEFKDEVEYLLDGLKDSLGLPIRCLR